MDLLFEIDDIMRMELTDRDNIEKKYVAIENSSKLNVKSLRFFPGGSAANIACNLANIGYKSAYIGGIGNDTSGDACLVDLQHNNVDTSYVKIFDDDATAHSVIIINPSHKDRSIMAYKGANDRFAPEHVPDSLLKHTRCFAWTSLTSDCGIAAIEKCIQLTRSGGGLIAAAPSISIIKNRCQDAIRLLKKSDICSLNDEEIAAITGIRNDVRTAMKQVFSWGVKIINVTMGKTGQWISDGKTLVKTEPPKIVVNDTTGAGDATFAGIIYGFLQKKGLQESAIIASSLSAMEIQGSGVRVGLPHKYSELAAFIESHQFNQETTSF